MIILIGLPGPVLHAYIAAGLHAAPGRKRAIIDWELANLGWAWETRPFLFGRDGLAGF